MSYTKTNWENGKTPINAENLNKIEEGIANAVDGGVVEEIPVTTQNISSGTITVYRCGKIAMVSIHDLKLDSNGVGVWSIPVATGLPIRATGTNDTFGYFPLFAKDNKIGLATVASNGQLGISCRDTNAMTTSEMFNGQFMYLIKE